MLNRLRNLKKLWSLSGKNQEFLSALSAVTPEDIKDIPDEDTKAVFMKPMTESDYQEYLHNEVHGWSKFNKHVADLIKNGRPR